MSRSASMLVRAKLRMAAYPVPHIFRESPNETALSGERSRTPVVPRLGEADYRRVRLTRPKGACVPSLRTLSSCHVQDCALVS